MTSVWTHTSTDIKRSLVKSYGRSCLHMTTCTRRDKDDFSIGFSNCGFQLRYFFLHGFQFVINKLFVFLQLL